MMGGMAFVLPSIVGNPLVEMFSGGAPGNGSAPATDRQRQQTNKKTGTDFMPHNISLSASM
jgi:hypothetical protein